MSVKCLKPVASSAVCRFPSFLPILFLVSHPISLYSLHSYSQGSRWVYYQIAHFYDSSGRGRSQGWVLCYLSNESVVLWQKSLTVSVKGSSLVWIFPIFSLLRNWLDSQLWLLLCTYAGPFLPFRSVRCSKWHPPFLNQGQGYHKYSNHTLDAVINLFTVNYLLM